MHNPSEILRHVDHTLLSQTAKSADIRQLCQEGKFFHTASVCLPPFYVKEAKKYLENNVKLCTVIGFPNGYSTSEIKAAEAFQAISEGADEIDMVINLGMLKDKRYNEIKNEIFSVKSACNGKTLKVIVETCFLTEDEKVEICRIVAESGADYIKTSTGFGTGNATFEDVALFARELKGTGVKIKASGGIKTFEDASRFLDLGADRLGSSSLVRILASGEEGKQSKGE